VNPGSHAAPRGARPAHAELERVDGGLDGRLVTPEGTVLETFGLDYRVALADGSETWATDLGSSVMAGPSVEPSTDTVYVGDQDESLYALDAESGDEQWETDVGGPIVGCPTVTSEHVLVGSYAPKLCAVEKTTGEEIWEVPAEGEVTSTPLVTDDAVYFAERTSEASLDGDGPTGALYRVVAD